MPALALGLPGLAPAPLCSLPASLLAHAAALRGGRWPSCWHLAGPSLWSQLAQGGRTEVGLGWGPRTLGEETIGGKNSPLFTIGHTSSPVLRERKQPAAGAPGPARGAPDAVGGLHREWGRGLARGRWDSPPQRASLSLSPPPLFPQILPPPPRSAQGSLFWAPPGQAYRAAPQDPQHSAQRRLVAGPGWAGRPCPPTPLGQTIPCWLACPFASLSWGGPAPQKAVSELLSGRMAPDPPSAAALSGQGRGRQRPSHPPGRWSLAPPQESDGERWELETAPEEGNVCGGGGGHGRGAVRSGQAWARAHWNPSGLWGSCWRRAGSCQPRSGLLQPPALSCVVSSGPQTSVWGVGWRKGKGGVLVPRPSSEMQGG